MYQPKWFKPGTFVRVVDCREVGLPDEMLGMFGWLATPSERDHMAGPWLALEVIDPTAPSPVGVAQNNHWWVKPKTCQPVEEQPDGPA